MMITTLFYYRTLDVYTLVIRVSHVMVTLIGHDSAA